MYDRRAWAELLQEILRDLRHSLQREVERFTFELENWINWLVMKPLPVDWRNQLSDFLAHWETEGFLVSPYSKRVLDWWIEAWARQRGFLPKSDPSDSASGPGNAESMAMAQAADVPVKLQSDVATPEKPASTAPKQRGVPGSWPALTASEAEAAQESTGLPWWYPLQPRNRLDSFWQRRLEGFGRDARDRLLAFFQEVAAIGRMARAIKDPETVDLEPLLAQQQKVQQAYDHYLQAKTTIYVEWTKYLTTESFIGPEVSKVFEKIDNALPNRVEGIKSPLDETLKGSRQASYEATVKKRRRTETAYPAFVWTDRVITAIELASLIGTIKAVFKQAIKWAVAKGLSRRAARSVAIGYAVAHVGTAAASAVVVGGVVPKVLVDAGLDEADVRAGLAVFRTLFTIVGLRAVGKQRPAKGRGRSGRRTPAKDKAAKDAKGLPWDKTHPLIEGVPDAGRTRAHEFLQQAVAEDMQASGGYVRLGMGKRLSDFSGRKHTPDIRPDGIGLTTEGRIDMFEILSPGQRRPKLEAKLLEALNQLPPAMRGEIRVIDPMDAFK